MPVFPWAVDLDLRVRLVQIILKVTLSTLVFMLYFHSALSLLMNGAKLAVLFVLMRLAFGFAVIGGY